MHKSGFVNIVGRPNVGKSTLMNRLVGERMSIITQKPQTTRHRIIGIVSDEHSQIIFSDTPGLVDDPAYKMHEVMNRFVQSAFEDADLILFMTDTQEQYRADDPLIQQLRQSEVPLFLLINKTDLSEDAQLLHLIQWWSEQLSLQEIVPISAQQNLNIDRLLRLIRDNLPEGPAYYPKDQLTDRSERFFVSEIIREKIMLLYHQEVPYYTEVIIDSFKDDSTKSGAALVRIGATVYVGRQTQKAILIGKNGTAIKRLGTEARKDIEDWLESKVFLELHVKVRENWRDDDKQLKHFGY